MAKDDFYSAIACGYDALHKDEQLAKLKIILSIMHPKSGNALLDVGCGTAFASQSIKGKYFGIDNSLGALKHARKENLRKNAHVALADAECLPFRDGQFDYVISITAIHNVGNYWQALEEMHRVCKKELAITVLRKSKWHSDILAKIWSKFDVHKVVMEQKDSILFCRKR